MIHLVAVKIDSHKWAVIPSDVRDKYANEKAPAEAYVETSKAVRDWIEDVGGKVEKARGKP